MAAFLRTSFEAATESRPGDGSRPGLRDHLAQLLASCRRGTCRRVAKWNPVHGEGQAFIWLFKLEYTGATGSRKTSCKLSIGTESIWISSKTWISSSELTRVLCMWITTDGVPKHALIQSELQDCGIHTILVDNIVMSYM